MNNSFFRPLMLLLVLTGSQCAMAQTSAREVHFGLIGGLHGTSVSYSDLPTGLDDPKGSMGFGGGIYAEFPLSDIISLRPQVSLLSRGGKIEGINTSKGITNYSLSAQYTDIRLPLIFYFGKLSASVQPYAYVAPTLGFVRGGELKFEGGYEHKVDVSKANMASTYFAITPGVGLNFPLGKVRLGVEANYELGITDTYGSKEKDGKAVTEQMSSHSAYKVEGSRKFSGFEVQVSLAVPLSAFKSSSGTTKANDDKTRIPVQQQRSGQQTQSSVKQKSQERKAFYSLDEAISLAKSGERLKGVVINAGSNIAFATGLTILTQQSKTYLNRVAQFLIQNDLKADVRAHTDSQGADDVNLRLSRQRAESVYNYLLQKGVRENRLSYSYYGETQPIQSNDTESGRRANRRVEIVIK